MKKAKELGNELYIDSRGRWRSTETNEVAHQRWEDKKWVGISTGIIYKDPVAEKVEEINRNLEKKCYPVRMEKCLPYTDRNGKLQRYALREISSGKMFDLINCIPHNAPKGTYCFIAYLDEGHNPTGEYKYLSSFGEMMSYKGI